LCRLNRQRRVRSAKVEHDSLSSLCADESRSLRQARDTRSTRPNHLPPKGGCDVPSWHRRTHKTPQGAKEHVISLVNRLGNVRRATRPETVACWLCGKSPEGDENPIDGCGMKQSHDSRWEGSPCGAEKAREGNELGEANPGCEGRKPRAKAGPPTHVVKRDEKPMRGAHRTAERAGHNARIAEKVARGELHR
jgi:hypothetical protein